MEWKQLLIGIPIYWIILSFIITGVSNDPAFSQISSDGDTNIINNRISNFNASAPEGGDQTGASDILSTFGTLFGFRNPSNENFPGFIVFFLGLINWVSAVLLGLAIYRVLNPFA